YEFSGLLQRETRELIPVVVDVGVLSVRLSQPHGLRGEFDQSAVSRLAVEELLVVGSRNNQPVGSLRIHHRQLATQLRDFAFQPCHLLRCLGGIARDSISTSHENPGGGDSMTLKALISESPVPKIFHRKQKTKKRRNM